MKKFFTFGLIAVLLINLSVVLGSKLVENIDSIPTVYAINGESAEDEEPEPEDGAAESEDEGSAEDEEAPAEDGEAVDTADDVPTGAETGFSTSDIFEQLGEGARTVLLLISDLFSVFLLALNYLLWPILIMIGALMDNSIIFGGGMEDRLLTIWSQIRNIVNLGFVVVLIGMALYNVLGIGEEGNYTIKKILPKFVIALILVNFSFLAGKVILDAANVMTTAVFALPNAVEEELNLTDIDQLEQAVCNQLDDIGGIEARAIDIPTGGQNQMCADRNNFTSNARQFFQTLSANNIALVMAVNMGQIHEGLEVSQLVRTDPSLTNLTINIIFSIIMYVVYASAYIALFFVLLVRVVVLWLVLALSPLVALSVVLPEGGGLGNFDIKDMFVQHAIGHRSRNSIFQCILRDYKPTTTLNCYWRNRSSMDSNLSSCRQNNGKRNHR